MKNPSSSLLHLAISAGLPVLFFCGIALVRTPVVRMTSVPVAVQVRHAPVLNGRVEGSVQQMLGEAVRLNGSASITGDLLLPGTPTVRINGQPTYGGLTHGSGDTQPSGYVATLNGGSSLGHIVDRTDPVALATVPSPPASTGTRSVTINGSAQSVGDWATVRDLTLNGSAGVRAVPPGTYRNFVANGNGFELGVAGSQQVAVYNLQQLTMNGASVLRVVGPVKLVVNSQINMNGTAGSAAVPGWLTVEVAEGGVTLNGGSSLYGAVRAPSGAVTVNGSARLVGSVVADRLTVNGGGVITGAPTDTTAPQVAITTPLEGLVTNASTVTVTGTVADESAVTVTVNGVAAALTDASWVAEVPLSVEGSNALIALAADASGNTTQATRTIVRDTVAPVISVESPAIDQRLAERQVAVLGSIEDLTRVGVIVDVSEAPRTDVFETTLPISSTTAIVNGGNFSTVVGFGEGPYFVTIHATDAAGNRSTAVRRVVVRTDEVAPALVVSEPANGTVGRNIIVSGLASDPLLSLVLVNDSPVDVEASGAFHTTLDLEDGVQTIRVAAFDESGNTVEVVRTVTVDKRPPVLVISSPEEGSTVDATGTIEGNVEDVSAVQVTVGLITATVDSGGHFIASGVPVAEGPTSLAVRALDAVGNETTTVLSVVGRDRTPPSLPQLFPTKAVTRLGFQVIEGMAESGSTVVIAGGDQTVSADAASGSGLFAATVFLPVGTSTLGVTAVDADGNVSQPVAVTVTSDPNIAEPPAGQAFQINAGSGNAQKGLVGANLPRPLIAYVTDAAGAPVSGARVRFECLRGGGHFAGAGDSVEVDTDDWGHAASIYVSGTVPGPQVIRADFDGNTATSAVFLSEALEPTGTTRVSGVVLDQNLRALPNVLVRLAGQETRTGDDGRFALADVAAGPHQLLELIGRDQIPLPGRWPNISYDFDVLAGVDNTLGRPLFLPRVNGGIEMPLDANGIVTEDTTFVLPIVGVEPIRVTARAGTHVTFPPDVTDRRLSVTRIATNRVPMALEDGRSTSLYISVQPSGAVFDQPLEISFPNLDRRPAGSEVLLMSFDHDAGRYVRVGTGHVSGDGRRVTSDPGTGIHVGAWHALPPDPPDPEVTVTGFIQIDGNPEFEGHTIRAAEAWVEGVRAVLLNATSGSAGKQEAGKTNDVVVGTSGRLSFRATLTVKRKELIKPLKLEATVVKDPVVLRFERERIAVAEGKTRRIKIFVTSGAGAEPKFAVEVGDAASAVIVGTPTENEATIEVKGLKKGKETKLKVKYLNVSMGTKPQEARADVGVVKIEFKEFDNCRNFDKRVTDPENDPFTLAVVLEGNQHNPVAGTGQVKVRVTPGWAASEVAYESADTSKFTVAAPPAGSDVITVTGLDWKRDPGVTPEPKLLAKVDNQVAGELYIAVRRRLQLRVHFFFVLDGPTGTHKMSNREASSLTQLLTDANGWLTAQTGIELVPDPGGFYSDLKFTRDLGPVVSNAEIDEVWNTTWATARYNVYLVNDNEHGDSIWTPASSEPEVKARTNDKAPKTALENDSTAYNLAHEILHQEKVQIPEAYAFPRVKPRGTFDVWHARSRDEVLYPTEDGGCLIFMSYLNVLHRESPPRGGL